VRCLWLHITYRPRRVTASTPADEALVDSTAPPSRTTYRGLRAGNRRKMTHQVLREVADVYTAAVVTGAPTKAVTEHFGPAPSTASLYVKTARDAGLLPPPD
jgi:hypothetical protein